MEGDKRMGVTKTERDHAPGMLSIEVSEEFCENWNKLTKKGET